MSTARKSQLIPLIATTPESIEGDVATSLREAVAAQREALELLLRSVTNDLRRLDAGKAIEGGYTQMGERIERRTVAAREREDALAAVKMLRAVMGAGK